MEMYVGNSLCCIVQSIYRGIIHTTFISGSTIVLQESEVARCYVTDATLVVYLTIVV